MRRLVLALLCLALPAVPTAAAQPAAKVYRIGYLAGTGPAVVAPSMAAFGRASAHRGGLKARPS
jgi:hypothetical protein